MSLLVEPLEVLVEPALDLGPRRAVGVLGEELAGALDQVGQRGVGQRLGADQVLDELPVLGEPSGVQLLLERLGQLQGLGAAGVSGNSRRKPSMAASAGRRGRRWRPASGPRPRPPSSAGRAGPAPGPPRPCGSPASSCGRLVLQPVEPGRAGRRPRCRWRPGRRPP